MFKNSLNSTPQSIVIGERVFVYDRDQGQYFDSEMAGFLRQSPDGEDCWSFSGDGYLTWAEGTFGEICEYLTTDWEPEPLDEVELILLKLWHDFNSIEVGDLLRRVMGQTAKVVALHPEIEGQEQALSCQSPNGEIFCITFDDWRDNIWQRVGVVSPVKNRTSHRSLVLKKSKIAAF